MSKFERVLSDAELISATFKTETEGTMGELRAVEQAVLAKLAEQEPVMYARTYYGEIDWDEACVTEKNDGTLMHATDMRKEDFVKHGYEIIPLYTHPITSKQGILDSSKTITKENLPPLPKPHCKHGGGIGYFDSFTKDQMIDYAKSAIDHYRATSNHIADKRKMAAHALQNLTKELQSDGDYAWTWHCNIAVPIMDSTGLSHREANIAAARLMQIFFGINTEKHPNFEVDHIPDTSKVVNDADQALRNGLDLVSLDISAYSSPKEALAALIDWHVSVAIDSRTNGGWQLVPTEPTENQIVSAMEASLLGRPSIDDEAYAMSIIDAYLKAAPKYEEVK